MGSLAARTASIQEEHAQAVEDESNTSVDDVASLALAEKGRLHEIILAADALAASLRFFYPRTVPKEPSDQKLAGTYASDGIEIGYRIWKAPKRPAPGKGRHVSFYTFTAMVSWPPIITALPSCMCLWDYI